MIIEPDNEDDDMKFLESNSILSMDLLDSIHAKKPI